jgi:hypothetical protein
MTYHVAFDCTHLTRSATQLVSSVNTAYAIVLTVVLLALLIAVTIGRRLLGELRLVFCIALITAGYVVTYYHLLPRSSQLIEVEPTTPAVCRAPSKVAAGTVSEFIPMPYGGHAMEHFCIRELCFNYSDYELTGGFNTTSSHGGPVRAGLSVRVTYVESPVLLRPVIVKLEIENQAI